MKVAYTEGAWFTLPLRDGGFALGVVARATLAGGVILCYFFGTRHRSAPPSSKLDLLGPNDALRVLRVSDLDLVKGRWRLIGKSSYWKREDWPIPAYLRREEFSGKMWRVHYSDDDPNVVVQEELVTQDEAGDLDNDALFGAGAAEALMNHLLK